MESKIEQCKTRANEALASMNKKLVKEMLSQKESLTQTKAVFGALYLFLGLHKPTEIKNFIQKLTMGGLYLVSYLKDINLKKVPVSNIQDAESALSEVSEDELQSELETAYHLYQWLSNTIEVYITQMQLEQEVNAQAMEELDKVVTQELDNSVIQDAKKVVTERTNHLASQETINTLQAPVSNKLEEVKVFPESIVEEVSEGAFYGSPEPNNLDTSQSPEKDKWSQLEFNVPESEIAGLKFPDWIASKIKEIHQSIDKGSITEMVSLSSPPAAVFNVMQAVNYMLGYKSKKDKQDALKIFKKNNKDLIKNLQSIDFLTLKYTNCKQIQTILKGLDYPLIKRKSKAAADLFSMINNFLEARIGTELYGEGRVKRAKSTQKSVVTMVTKPKSPLKSSPKRKKSKNKTTTKSTIIDPPANVTLSNPKTQFSGDFRTVGFEWSDIRNASMREKLRSEWNEEKEKFQKNQDIIMRNSIKAEQKVLEKVRKSPIRQGQSPIQSKYRTDAHINKEILKERMSPKNIKKNVKSRVSYHWDKKRQKEMKTESDYMSGYYTYGIIYEILRDVNLRRVSVEDARNQLEEHGYKLKANEEGATQKYRVSPLRSGARGDERVQIKEYRLCVQNLRNAANRITDQSLLDLINDKNLSIPDQILGKIFIGILELVNDGKSDNYPTWSKVKSELEDTTTWIRKVDSLESLVGDYTLSDNRIDELKNKFIRYNEEISDKPYVTNIKDFLSEALVYIEIVHELRGVRQTDTIEDSNNFNSTFERLAKESESVIPVVTEEIKMKQETPNYQATEYGQEVQVIKGMIRFIITFHINILI